MFRSFVESFARRFAHRKKTGTGETSPLSSCPTEAGKGTPEHVFLSEHSPCRSEQELSAPELTEQGPPKSTVFPICNRSLTEKEIQRQAYLRWETAGKPEGHDRRFWREAREELCQGK
jgi:hypothetical protein